MRVLVEGPRWAGLWTEAVRDACESLGWETGGHFHNERDLAGSLSNRLWRATSRRSWLPSLGTSQADRSNAALGRLLAAGGWDVLLSIQGKLDGPTVEAARAANPGLRIVFWWGDILTDRGRERIRAVAPMVDTVLMSYRGDLERMRADGVANAELFLFGLSPRYHLPATAGGAAPGHDVVLVGTCYPGRCEAIRALNRHLERPVAVWGRSWRRCPGVGARGALALPEAQRVHATARIALNIHHHDTRDGVNMKYFEIPAAGALQIVDHQPLMDEALGDRGVVTFRDVDELVERVRYFLAHESERAERAAEAHRAVLETDGYAPRLARLLRAS